MFYTSPLGATQEQNSGHLGGDRGTINALLWSRTGVSPDYWMTPRGISTKRAG
jgi:hypothetical protein